MIVPIAFRFIQLEQSGLKITAVHVKTDYLFSSRALSENLFPDEPRTEYLFSVEGAGHGFLCFA